MASRMFDVEEAISAIFDDDFGLSDGELSGEEGEDIYPYLGEPILVRSTVEELTRAVVDDDGRSDANFSDDNYFEGANDALTRAAELGELDGSTGGLGDEAMGSESDENAAENFPGTSREFGTFSDDASVSNSMPSDSSASDSSASDSSASGSDSESLSSSEGASSQHSKGGRSSRGGTRGRGRGVGQGRARGGGRGHTRGGGRGCGRGGGRGRARGGGRGHARGGGRGRACGGGRGCGHGGGRGPTQGGSIGGRNGSRGLEPVGGIWEKKQPTSVRYAYKLSPGPSSSLTGSVSPLDLFSCFFTHTVWDLLVTETNRFASQNSNTSAHARPWHDTTVAEMMAFTGILIIMGIIQLPRLEMYWQQSHTLLTTPGVSSIMSLVRFEQIFRFLHLANSDLQIPAGEPGYDRLFKVRGLLDIVTPLFEAEYNLHEQVTIDEAMIPFKGRLSFKQYMKDKPVKWGIKVFTLSDATNGYVYRIQIYTGKNMEDTSDVGLCSKVVLDLMAGLEDSGFELYTDNYYTSPQLYLTLYKKGINACGTVRTNRKEFPPELVHRKGERFERGFYDYRSNGPLLAAFWVDRRFIHFLTTLHTALPSSGAVTTIMRREADGSRVEVQCPPLLPDYQTYMRGVDRGDQMIGFYNAGRRSKKWWKRVFFHILECCILNAYVLDSHVRPLEHALRGRKKRDYLSFRIELAEMLIGTFRSRQRAGRRVSAEHSQLDRLNPALGHWPVSATNKLDCVVCSLRRKKQGLPRAGNRHESRIKCCHCNVHLCVDQERDCFCKYHSLVEFWS